jgi:hypothetical protein
MLIAFFSIFFAVGLGMLGYSLYSIKKSNEVATWPMAIGRILSSEMTSISDSDGTTYRVKVAYDYSVMGQTHHGDRIAFGYSGSSGQEAHQQILERLPVGRQVEVRYRPDKPEEAALAYGFHRSTKFTLAFSITWLLFTSGMALMFWLFSRPDQALLDSIRLH